MADVGEFDEALAEQVRALALVREEPSADGHRLRARLLLLHGGILRVRGNFDAAIALYGQAEETAAPYDKALQGRCVDAQAAAHLDAGRVRQAVLSAERASEVAASAGAADLARQANGTLALSYLHEDRLADAQRAANDAARFSRSRRVIGAHLLQGMVAYRRRKTTRDTTAAERAFLTALSNTRALRERTPRGYETLDLQGLALTGLMLCGDDRAHDDAVEAYLTARRITSLPGVRRRVEVLFNALTAEVNADLVASLRQAALNADVADNRSDADRPAQN
jgi:tetratricopeptide (TPR) repeat protein